MPCLHIAIHRCHQVCMPGNTLRNAADDTGDDGGAVPTTKRRKRTWEEASDDEGADPEAVEAARKEAEMETDRSAYLML